MATTRPPENPEPSPPLGDPWRAFGYVVSGVLVYGLAGWGLDQWWGTTFMVAIGLLVGAAFGIYMTWARFRQYDDVPPKK